MARSFPMNAWYAAAWDVDIKRALFPRTICGKHIVMYRQADGQVAALEDACWHRLVPLSKGRLEGDHVVCGYHGLKYNSSGRCTSMPFNWNDRVWARLKPPTSFQSDRIMS